MPETEKKESLAVLTTKMENLGSDFQDSSVRIAELEIRLRAAEEKIARLEERLTLWQAAQALYATIAAALAAYLGTK